MNLGIQSISNPNQLKDIILACAKAKIPLLCHGKPGIGKSQIFKSVVTKILKIQFLDFRLSQVPVEDLAGLPIPTKIDTGKYLTVRSLPDFLPKEGKGCLFFDEINQANPAVLNAIFQLILDRKMLGTSYELPEDWFIMAACNDFEYNKNVTEFEPPLNDRFLHVNFDPDPQIWLNWAEKHKFEPEILSFIRENKECLYGTNLEITEQVVFPSARSWERVDAFFKMFKKDELSQCTFYNCICGLISTQIASEFMKSLLSTENEIKEKSKEDFFIEDFFNLNDNITDLDNYLETAKNDFQLNKRNVWSKVSNYALENKFFDRDDPATSVDKYMSENLKRLGLFLSTFPAEEIIRNLYKLAGKIPTKKFLKIFPEFGKPLMEAYEDLGKAFGLDELEIYNIKNCYNWLGKERKNAD